MDVKIETDNKTKEIPHFIRNNAWRTISDFSAQSRPGIFYPVAGAVSSGKAFFSALLPEKLCYNHLGPTQLKNT
jgi:hypothetical protein